MIFKRYSIKIWFILKIFYLYLKTLLFKKCIVGPFVGEFGHLLSYIIPFISFLNSKGVKVSYRKWNRQLRQPILLAAPRSMVSVSPQQGYLHPVSELDTLGVDDSESTCKF